MNANSSFNSMVKRPEENSRLKSLQSVWSKRGLVGLVTFAGIGATYLAIIIARDRPQNFLTPLLVNVEAAHPLIDGYMSY